VLDRIEPSVACLIQHVDERTDFDEPEASKLDDVTCEGGSAPEEAQP
jgi:hypothetical protein